MKTIGVDIGGTKIASAIVMDKELLGDPLISKTPKSTEDIINTVVEQINTLKSKHEIDIIGISTAGAVDSEIGKVIGSTGNLPSDYTHTNLSMEIYKKTGIRPYVENDANAAAVAEMIYGNGIDYNSFVFIIIGTGIGGSIIINKKIYKGTNNYGGECGHLIIDYKEGRACTCGSFGCFEAYGSGPGLVKTAKDFIKNFPQKGQPSSLLSKSVESVTTYDIINAAKQQDSLGIDIYKAWHIQLAAGITSIINLIVPQIVILGGAMAQFIDYDVLNRQVHQQTLCEITVTEAYFKNNAGIIGAAILAKNFRLSGELKIT